MLVQTNIRVNIIRILDEISVYCELLCMYNVSLYSLKYVLCICYVCIMYISYTCVSRIYISITVVWQQSDLGCNTRASSFVPLRTWVSRGSV